MITAFVLNGECGFSGIWSSITASRGFNANLLNIPHADYYVRYTGGATAAMRVGEKITGGTSSATMTLVAQAVENGAAGSSDSGIIFLKLLTGTPAAAGETWTGAVSTGTVATAQAPLSLTFRGQPKSALITVETATITFTQDGTIPTASAGTNYGHQMVVGQSYVIQGWNNIRNFRCINTVNANGAVVKYSLFY